MNVFKRILPAAALAAGLPLFGQAAGLRLNQYYGSNAVLQRGVAIPVSGTAAAGASVSVSFNGASVSGTADAKGAWKVELPTQQAGGPYTLTVSSGGQTMTSSNVMVGEVWLVSGQSNAYYPIERFAAKDDWLKDANYPNVRFIMTSYYHPTTPDAWQVASASTAEKCSAMGFFFAKELQKSLNVPVGVVTAAHDGSWIAQWFTDGDRYKGYIANDLDPLSGFPVKGVLWYQGESDGMYARGYEYRSLLTRMIGEWRTAWNAPKLPFVVVQLPYYGAYELWYEVRDSQNWVGANVSDVIVVPTLDIGDMNDIHPPKKPELGARLSTFVRKYMYGETGLCPEGPVYKSSETNPSNAREILVHFDVHSKIVSSDGQALKGFQVGGKYFGQNKFFGGTARIVDDDTIGVTPNEQYLEPPFAVRYGMTNTDTVNFFDADGNPARAFRTDNWKLPTQPSGGGEGEGEGQGGGQGQGQGEGQGEGGGGGGEPVVDPTGALLPSGDTTGAKDASAIQSAIDAAGANGTVTLGLGTFYLNASLTVASGVTLRGLGREKTTLRQTAKVRVVTLDGGAKLESVTVTGGKVDEQFKHGAGVEVKNGTVSWCCISNNMITANGKGAYGAGVYFAQGTIDHSIVACNSCQGSGKGGGIGITSQAGAITIDACLVIGNAATYAFGANKGGGIGIEYTSAYTSPITIRGTTIAGNSAGTSGQAAAGAAVFAGSDYQKKVSMVNCIVAGNSTQGAETDVDLYYEGGVDYCLFDKSGDKLGDHSAVGDPKFADGGYRLSSASPAKGAGTAYSGIGKDLAGVDFANPPSMGCYEFVGSTPPPEEPVEDEGAGAALYID